jgi:hypothetical protein
MLLNMRLKYWRKEGCDVEIPLVPESVLRLFGPLVTSVCSTLPDGILFWDMAEAPEPLR